MSSCRRVVVVLPEMLTKFKHNGSAQAAKPLSHTQLRPDQ